jgi:hypothetical protein
MNQFQIEEIEDREIEYMHYHPYPNDNILRYPNPVLIIGTFVGSHKFMVPDDYYPDENTEYDESLFRLLPNTAIEYKSLGNGQDILYHLELNSVKLDKHKRPVKKF